jgi:hypothetical protein
VLHHDPARVARQALGRFRGNAHAVLQDGLAGCVGVGEHGRVDVNHDLIALARGSGIDAVMECRFREERERVRLLLFEGKRFRGNVTCVGEGLTLLLIQGLAGCGQRLQEHRAGLRRQPAADDHHAVFVLIHAERAIVVALCGFARLGDAIHTAPAADDSLDVAGGAGPAHSEQTLFSLRRGHAGERPHLGVRELASREGLGQSRQRRQGAGHPHAFPGRAQVEPHAPAQPGGARAESRVPAAAGVELADEIEQARGFP